MKLLGVFMRIYSYAFHAILGLLMLAVGILILTSGTTSAWLGFVPWSGAELGYWLTGLGLAGVALAALAVRRILPVLFLLWTLFVVGMLVRGFFLSGHYFSEPSGFFSAVGFTLAALLTVVGGWIAMRHKPASR